MPMEVERQSGNLQKEPASLGPRVIRQAIRTAFKLLRHAPLVFKKILFTLYCQCKSLPQERKDQYKSFVGKTIWGVQNEFHEMGYVPYCVKEVWLELNPCSFIDRQLILGREHDPLVSRLIWKAFHQGGTFIDVGANIGYFSLMAARLPGVRVLAFEPSPREQGRFYRNMALNQSTNITLFPCGLGEKTAILPFHLAEMTNPGMNSAVVCSDGAVTVDSFFVPFDSVFPDSLLLDVKICKIDVEGYELSVLKGMARSLPRMERAIFIVEMRGEHLAKAGHWAEEVYEFFDRFGYTPLFGSENLPESSDGAEVNEIFIRKSERREDWLLSLSQ